MYLKKFQFLLIVVFLLALGVNTYYFFFFAISLDNFHPLVVLFLRLSLLTLSLYFGFKFF